MTDLSFARPVENHTDFTAIETPEEHALRSEVRAFAWNTFEEMRDQVDARGRCDDLMPLLGDQGLIGTLVRKEYGGEGRGLSASVIIAQELGGVIPSLAAMRAICGNFVAKPLEEFGTPEQIDTYLRPLMSGECTTALAITEPSTGSDVASMTTVARADGGDWVVRGRKKHISGAKEARFLLLYATTAPEAPLSRRLTAFLVPMDAAGVVIRPENTMGVKGLSHCEVDLDDVRIDDSMRLGEVGQGLNVMFFGLAAERIDIAARALGCATRAFEEARAFSAVRGPRDRPIRRYQAVSHRIADMRVSIDAARLLALRAARVYDAALVRDGAAAANRACDSESAIAKLFCARECFRVCDDAMQVMGGLGYERGAAVEAMFRDSRVFRFGGGTDEIQQHIIQREEYRRLAD